MSKSRNLHPVCTAKILLTAAQASPVGTAVAVIKLDIDCLAVASRLLVPVRVCAATIDAVARTTVVDSSFMIVVGGSGGNPGQQSP